MTFDEAKTDPKLNAYFHSKILDTIDAEIENMLGELEVNDAQIAEFKTEKSTFKKLRRLHEINRANEKQKTGTLNSEKETLQSELEKLNQQITANQSEYHSTLLANNEGADKKILDFAIHSSLGSKQYAEHIPVPLRISSAKNILQNEFDAKGIRAVIAQDNTLQLVKSAEPGLSYTENGNPVSFGAFADKLLAAHAMLKVSDPETFRSATHNFKINSGSADFSGVLDANKQQIMLLEKRLSPAGGGNDA